MAAVLEAGVRMAVQVAVVLVEVVLVALRAAVLVKVVGTDNHRVARGAAAVMTVAVMGVG